MFLDFLNFKLLMPEHSPTLAQIFFNLRNIYVSVAVFRNILLNILQYITKVRDIYTYITEI
jgi:hypothetical protein